MTEQLEMEEVVFDKSKHFPNAVAAETKGTNTLILTKLAVPTERVDGKTAAYELAWWWHPSPLSEMEDPAGSVQGSEVTLWTAKEIRAMGVLDGKPLFESFYLF